MLQCKCGISALHVDRVCAVCYSNSGLVISNTHTHHPVSPAESFFSRISFFSASKISQFQQFNLYFTSLDYCCTTPDCLRAPFSHFSLPETLNRTVHRPPVSPHLPHSICLTRSHSLSLKIKRYIDKKKKRKKEEARIGHWVPVYTWSWGWARPIRTGLDFHSL